MAWQFAFFVIATNPARFRPMMILSVIEKLGYIATVAVLHLQGQLSRSQLITSSPDALLGVLFLIAFYIGAADKAVNLVGCKSPHHQLPGRVVSISDACGGNEACSART